jgi:hypothetical protein
VGVSPTLFLLPKHRPPKHRNTSLLSDHRSLGTSPPLFLFISAFQPFSIYPIALFGQTAKQCRDANPAAEGNLRDHAPLEQLVVLTNLESLNSVLIRQGLPQPARVATLNDIAITQMRTLLNASSVKRLK